MYVKSLRTPAKSVFVVYCLLHRLGQQVTSAICVSSVWGGSAPGMYNYSVPNQPTHLLLANYKLLGANRHLLFLLLDSLIHTLILVQFKF